METLEEKIQKTEAAMAAIERDLYIALADLEKNGATTPRVITHGRKSYEELRPNPALRRQRECLSSLRTLRVHLFYLKKERDGAIKATTPSRWTRFAPKPRENEVQ
jgi:hypothetical protein